MSCKRTAQGHLSFSSTLLLTTLVTSSVPLEAQQHFSVISENDIYAPRGQDRHYSNGIRIGYGLQQKDDSWYSWLGQFTSLNTEPKAHQYEIAFGQNIYTPEYFIATAPILHDRPFAGWLYSELSVNTHNPGTSESVSINLGMVGPVALAEQGQKLIHDIIGDPEPAGWDNQLRNEPALLIRYRRSWFLPVIEFSSIQAEFIPGLGVNLGNVFTDAGIGAAVRIGHYLPEQDLPARMQPGLSGGISNFSIRKNQFDWMLYAEIQGRAVAHNIFLDGNTFTDSQFVDKRTIVRDLATGIAFGFGRFNVPVIFSFSIVWRGREFDLQKREDSFGSAMIAVQY